MLSKPLLWTCLASALLVQTAGLAAAPHATPTDDRQRLEARLAGDREAEIAGALQEIAASNATDMAPAIANLLARGSTPGALAEAFKTAGKLKSEELSAAIAPYVWHRDRKVRRAAVKALLKTRGPVAVATLRRGLRSGDAMVRGTSATGLGTLNAAEALEELFMAFDRNVPEAAASLGQLCKPDECERFAGYLGKAPFDIITSGFDQILFRPAKEMPDEQKIRIIGRLRELGTANVGKYLAEVAERWPKGWSAKVKASLDGAVKATGGSTN